MKMGLVVLIAILLFMPSESLFAIDGKSNLATLRGLKGVGVLVENLPPEVEKEGLIKNQIQIEVESKLRAAGIKVLTREECLKTPGQPYLYININVNTAKTESDLYPYAIDALLIQKVSLLRNPELTTYAVTWSMGGIGSIDKQILGQLRGDVEEVVQVFIKAFLSENPK
jgi:hypothetical protein